MAFLKMLRSYLYIASLFVSLYPSSFAFAHEETSRVVIELESPEKISPGKTTVEFQLVDTEKNKIVTPTELNIIHERKLHFLVYDPSLKEFQHVHPEFVERVWKAELNFEVDGKYFIWAQGELSSDSEEFSALNRIEVAGGKPAWPSPPVLGDSRSGSNSGSIATLSNERLKAGKMAMLTLKFSREDGTPVKISPYLGAFAHIVSTPTDGDDLIHVHPMNGSDPSEGMLHVTFPKVGFYRLWVQFIDNDCLKTIPLSVEVL